MNVKRRTFNNSIFVWYIIGFFFENNNTSLRNNFPNYYSDVIVTNIKVSLTIELLINEIKENAKRQIFNNSPFGLVL